MYIYILYLRCKDVIIAVLCTALPITTTIAGELVTVQHSMTIRSVLKLMVKKLMLVPIIYVTGFWKTSQIFTLRLFHFIGPAIGYHLSMFGPMAGTS